MVVVEVAMVGLLVGVGKVVEVRVGVVVLAVVIPQLG
jgi:hypothetical protein